MRVITGSARGRRLKELEGMETRPTTDRVKEGLFSAIQFDIEGRKVLDLFAGTGQLGIECLSRGAASAVFVDRRADAVKLIRENLKLTELSDRARVVPGDAMKLDLAALVSDKFSGLTAIACANLPYNITTPVLTALIEAGCFASITVMIQREVALRICAAPGSSDYGAFSVFCQYHTQPELLFEVGPECFLPAPKVTSAVIRLVPRSAPPQNLVDESFFFQVVRASFAQRRKTLLNGLSSAFGSRLSKDALRGAIEAAGLPADIRGERLGIPEFAALASALQSSL